MSLNEVIIKGRNTCFHFKLTLFPPFIHHIPTSKEKGERGAKLDCRDVLVPKAGSVDVSTHA